MASLKSPWKAKPVALIRDHQIYRFGEGDRSFESMPDVGLHLNQYTGSLLFNGMIAPLVPYAIRGVIWYQGESNVGRGEQYETLFPAMIRSWRRTWATHERAASEQRAPGANSIDEVPTGEISTNEMPSSDIPTSEMPFYYVQIAPYNYEDPSGDATARLREAQRNTMNLPGTGMVVTTDIGNPTNIHPANKQDVGRRLARWALAREYGIDIDVSGPMIAEARLDSGTILLQFDFAESGLMSGWVTGRESGRESETPAGGIVRGFEVIDTEGNLWPAEGIIEGSTVIINWSRPGLADATPAEIRFGWAPAPEVNLFDRNGLPASPFRIVLDPSN